jgi:electron transfer flavoprotein beta subunit
MLERHVISIVVCVKQTVDPQQVQVKRDTREPIVDGLPLVISDIDKNAVEEAVRLKEKLGEATITVLSLGAAKVRETIKGALAMGADKAIILTDPALLGGDPMATATALAAAVRKLDRCDLLILGEGSADNYSGQVGPRLAELLDLPDITYVERLEIVDGTVVRAARSLEDGVEVVETELPALVTVSASINEPRIPALRNIMAVGRKPLLEWSATDVGLTAQHAGAAISGVRQISNVAPLQERKRIIFSGEPDEAARQLADALREQGVGSRE